MKQIVSRRKAAKWGHVRGTLIALALGALLLVQTACNPWFTPQTSSSSPTEIDWAAATVQLPEPIDNPDIDMTVEIGYDNAYPLQTWTELRATIENRGADFDGHLVLPVRTEDASTAVEYAVAAHIPSGATKQISLPFVGVTLRKDMSPRLEQDGQIVERVNVENLTPLPIEWKLIGTLSDNPESLAYWKDRAAVADTFIGTNTVVLSAESVPDIASAYDNFGAIVIDDFDLMTLEEAQRTAIRDWLERGGILIVGSGPAGQKTLAGLSEIAPVSMAGSADSTGTAAHMGAVYTDMTPMQGDPSLARLSAGDQTLLQTPGGASLVERYDVGDGYVLAAAFELGKRPFASWRDAMTLWHHLLTTTGANAAWKQYTQTGVPYYNIYYNPYESALSNIPAGHMPSIPLVFGILAGFCVLAGPVLYYVLKRRDRRDWAWFIIPALSVAFALGVFSFGLGQDRDEIAVSTVSIIKPTSNGAIGMRHAGAILPNKGVTTISTDQSGLVRPMFSSYGQEYAYSYAYPTHSVMYAPPSAQQSGVEENQRVLGRVIQGASPGVSYHNNANWSMGYLTLNAQFDDVGHIEGALHSADGKLTGKLVNQTGFTLDQVVVIGMTDYQSFDDIGAGETFDVSLRNYDTSLTSTKPGLSTIPTSYDLFYNMQTELFKELEQPMNAFDDAQTEWRRELSTRRMALDAAYSAEVNPRIMSGQTGQIQIVAFSKEAGAFAIEVNGSAPNRSYHTGLILESVAIEYESEGRVEIPYGVIRAQLIKNESDQNAYIDIDGVSFQGTERVVMLLTIPEFARYDIEQLSLYCNSMFSAKLNIALWDAKAYPPTDAERAARHLLRGYDGSATQVAPLSKYPIDGSDPHWVPYEIGSTLGGVDAARFIDDQGAIKICIALDPTDPAATPENYQRVTLPTVALKGKVK